MKQIIVSGIRLPLPEDWRITTKSNYAGPGGILDVRVKNQSVPVYQVRLQAAEANPPSEGGRSKILLTRVARRPLRAGWRILKEYGSPMDVELENPLSEEEAQTRFHFWLFNRSCRISTDTPKYQDRNNSRPADVRPAAPSSRLIQRFDG